MILNKFRLTKMNKFLLMSTLFASLSATVFAAEMVPVKKAAPAAFVPWGMATPMQKQFPMLRPNTQFPSWNRPAVSQFPPASYGNGVPMQRYFMPRNAYPARPYYSNNQRSMPSMRSPYAWPTSQRTQPSNNFFPSFPVNGNPFNFSSPNMQASKMSPFGNSFSPSDNIAKNMPTPWKNSSNWNPWSNGQNQNMPFLPKQNNKKKAWGPIRNIWPDFYTDFTEEAWDKSTNAPYDMGRMPGGWRAPSLSSPDPVTVGDAVLNQFPPMMEEMGNMMDFAN